MMSVHNALEAWQAGEITAERATELTGAADVSELYEFARACDVEIRTARRISIALAENGELHILPAEMPEAENLVHVGVRRQNGVLTVSAEDIEKIRQVIGSSSHTPNFDHRGVSAADELDAMLTQISSVVQSRIDELRCDAEDDDVPAFKP